jgi:hypothetical protein
MTKRVWVSAAVAIAAVIGAVILVRFGPGGPEDDWICVDKTWVKHGNPSSPMPESGCGENIKTVENGS